MATTTQKYEVGQSVTADQSYIYDRTGELVERTYTGRVARAMRHRIRGGRWVWHYILDGPQGRTTWIDERRIAAE